MFNFLDSCLYAFASDDFVAKDFQLLSIAVPGVEASTAAAPAAAGAAAAGGGADASSGGAAAAGGFSIRVIA